MVKLRYNSGFSLIEMVVYISILALMLMVVLQVVFSITRSQRVIISVRNIENSATASLERVEREARGADSIVTASSTLGTSPGVLVFSSRDENGNTRTVEFYVTGESLRLKENGVDTGALTSSSTRVTSLIFTRFASSTVEGIRTDITLESGTSTYYKTERFYSSARLR